MNIDNLILELSKKYNLTEEQSNKILNQYKNDTRNAVTIEKELESLADYYRWQNVVTSAIHRAPALEPNQNYYIRTYDENSNVILQGVNIEKIGETHSGINEVDKVLIDNREKAYRKVNKTDVSDNDLEITICQIGNLLNVSSAEEYTVYNKDKQKDSIISRSVAVEEHEEYYDFTTLEMKVKKYIKEGKIKHSKVEDYEDFKFTGKNDDYVMIIEKSIQILRSLPMISQKDINNVKASYFDMLIFGYITNQVDRNLNNYGLICDKKTREYHFAPLFENSIIELPNLEEDECNFNGYKCNRNKIIDTLFNDYYEHIREQVTYIIDNKSKLLRNIDIIAKQNLSIDMYNKLMKKIINNFSYIEKKYIEKNELPQENAGFVNILSIVLLLVLITAFSVGLGTLLWKIK